MAQPTLANLSPPTATRDIALEELERARRTLAESQFGPTPSELARGNVEVLGALDPQAAFGVLGRESPGVLRSLAESFKEKLKPQRLIDVGVSLGQSLEEVQPAMLSPEGRAVLRRRINAQLTSPDLSEEQREAFAEQLGRIDAFERTVEHKEKTLEALR